MTFGQKIKKLRSDANLTQKELAEKMNVTFQTVSKWESDLNEPDISTIKELSKIFNCSIEYLFSEDDEQEVVEPQKEVEVEQVVPVVPVKKEILVCSNCGRTIEDDSRAHSLKKRYFNGEIRQVNVCDECYAKEQAEEQKKADEILESTKKIEGKKKHSILRTDNKALIAGAIVGGVALIVTLILCIIFYSNVGLLWTILLPIIIGYVLMADIYCIFTASFIGEVFMDVASWSIRFPGIIFSFSLDGFAFLIVMKILFFVLGILISIGAFLLALAIASFLSIFAFIPMVIHNNRG